MSIEETSALENQAVEAMMALLEDHGYTRDDLERLVDNAVGA